MPEFPTHLPAPGKRIVFQVEPRAIYEESGQDPIFVEAVVLSRRMPVSEANKHYTITTSDPDYQVIWVGEDSWMCQPTGSKTLQEQVDIRGIHVVD